MPEVVTGDGFRLTNRYLRALTLAFEIHQFQLRKGTEIPYLAHLMAVSALVWENGGDEDVAIAALLHDAIEDSADGAAVRERISREFGDCVADIVVGCSDAVAKPGQPKPSWRKRKEAYLERLRSETDKGVLLVSVCDKLHNARSIVLDLRTSGSAVWQRFNAPPSDQLWYYGSLVCAYPKGGIPEELREELKRTVAEMKQLAAKRTKITRVNLL